jgi:hypothetical protein
MIKSTAAVLHPYHYSSGVARALDHVHQHLLRGEREIPSLGTPAMAGVVQSMIESKWYHVELIEGRPGWIRVTPLIDQKPVNDPPPPSSSSWRQCALVLGGALLVVLAAVVWSFYLQIVWWRGFVETAARAADCPGFPCFVCLDKFVSAFTYIHNLPGKCAECCG